MGTLGKHWKLTEETKQKLSLSRKQFFQNGGVNPCGMLGRHHTEETKKKFVGRVPWNKGKRCPEISLRQMGDRNHLWKGGITPISTGIRNSIEIKLWRASIFERDNYTCQGCRIRGGKLQADHIKPFASFPELRLAIDNGQTLCIPCHKVKTKRDRPLIRSMNTQQQFQPPPTSSAPTPPHA